MLVFFVPPNGQGTANFVDTPLTLNRADSEDECRLFLPEPIDDVVINQVTLRGRHINVNVTDLFSILITEPTEHRMPCLRVEVGSIGYIGHTRTTARATVETNGDTISLAPRHHLAHKEHKARHINLVENPALLGNGLSKRINLLRSDSALGDFCFQIVV